MGILLDTGVREEIIHPLQNKREYKRPEYELWEICVPDYYMQRLSWIYINKLRENRQGNHQLTILRNMLH